MAQATRAYFVLVTADTCSFCHSFRRNTKAPLIASIQSLQGVAFHEINIASTEGTTDHEMRQYHPQLRQKIAWFPTFLLFNGSWNNPTTHLQGVVYNGTITSSGKAKFNIPGDRQPMDQVAITNWVNQQLVSNPIFAVGRSAAPAVQTSMQVQRNNYPATIPGVVPLGN